MIANANKSVLPIHREDIALSDKDILDRYMGINKVPCIIQSPLREDDKNPSFSLYYWGNKLLWKDFGTGERGNVIKLLSLLWHVEYTEALLKIKLDCGEKVPAIGLMRRYKGKQHITSNSTISVKVRDWKPWDKEYWNSYGISLKFCKWCNVYPISHAFFTREDKETGLKNTVCIPMDKYAYAYFEWKDDKQSVKLYQPFSTTMKWLSKHDHSVWDLWKQAFQWADKRSNDTLIITSSRKDAMCLWGNLRIPAMSLQGEGYIPKPQVMKQVLEKFKNVYLWYDNDYSHKEDNPGQDNARKLIEEFPELKNIVIPSEYRSKDPSDLYKNWGKEILKEIWEQQK